jgi:hypothetical protein
MTTSIAQLLRQSAGLENNNLLFPVCPPTQGSNRHIVTGTLGGAAPALIINLRRRDVPVPEQVLCLQTMERRIQRSCLDLEQVFGAALNVLGNRVAVSGTSKQRA